jgi:hypothetical protein
LKHVEPSINFGIINSIAKLNLVGISNESLLMECGLIINNVHVRNTGGKEKPKIWEKAI